MNMDRLTATEILEFFDKAEKLNLTYSVRKNPSSGNFRINVEVDWLADEWAFSSDIKVVVSGEGKDTFDGDYSLSQLTKELDKTLERDRRRKELIERLTEEEKDLLNLKG
jgi:asparagine synthetase B (glutamine-hydrolysing)